MLPLLPTTLVGSYPQPDWLIDRGKLLHQMPPRVRARELWRVAPEWLEQAQDDATVLAIRDQERAGLDIVTDGEMRRESYSNRFATALDGVDIDNPGTAINRSGKPIPVPRITARITRRRPVEVRDVELLRANTDRRTKTTVPGPFTMAMQAQDDFYGDPVAMAMDYAAAVNAEIRELKPAGADVIQLDELWLQARAEEARRLALPAIDRALDGIPGPTALHLCLRLCLCRRRQAEPLRVLAGAHGLEGRADLDRSRPAQSRSRYARRSRRQDCSRRDRGCMA